MDYEGSQGRIERQLRLAFGKKFSARTDITNFYPSVYSHAIPWALVGVKAAKQHQGPGEWFNQIDLYQRHLIRNETNGIPIGPATSNIVTEIILARVDETLRREDFTFFRFIDDYTSYCDTYEDAEKFIRRLSEELATYKLTLNIKKTSISQLPTPTSDHWISDLVTRKPDAQQLTTTNVIRFLDYAVTLQASSPDGSVIKYAVKTIMTDIRDNPNGKVDINLFIEYVLMLCIKYPILLPLLHILPDAVSLGNPFGMQLNNILAEHATNRRSDAMAWSMFYISRSSAAIPRLVAEKVVQSRDCVALLFLFMHGQYVREVVDFCRKLDRTDQYLLDQYWLLLYQMYFGGSLPNPYQGSEAQAFDILRRHGVSFLLP
jgi:hypothetical protein